MNVSTTGNRYYTSHEGSLRNSLLIKDDELLAAVTPQEAMARSRPVSQGSRMIRALKVVYELDGQEINPVDMLFQKPEPSREEKMKVYWQEKKKQTLSKLKQFKEMNKAAAESGRPDLGEAKKVVQEIRVKKRTKRADFNPWGEDHHDAVDETKKKPQARSAPSASIEVPKSPASPSPLEPPIAAPSPLANLSNVVWSALSLYWEPDAQQGPEPKEVVTKVYKRDQNNRIVLVEVRKGRQESRVASAQRVVSRNISGVLAAEQRVGFWETVRKYLTII